MKVHYIKTNTGRIIKYTRENWFEWLKVIYAVEHLEDNQIMPRFYLPVRRSETKYAYECWIFPLAPFVLMWIVFFRAFIGIWRDMLDVSKMLLQKNNLLK